MKLREFLTGFILMGLFILSVSAASDKAEACGDSSTKPAPTIKVVVA